MKTKIVYRSKVINGIKIAYREAGDPLHRTIVLLHGFPTSSHMYRKVLSELSDAFHLIAPDYPGFGDSDFPDPGSFTYSFDNLAGIMDAFIESFDLKSFTLMVQDYGAPVGFRIATAHPEKIAAIISQNGNIYKEGLGNGWAAIMEYWSNRNEETEKALLPYFSIEGLRWIYTHGTRNPEHINPDCWNLDYLRISRPNSDRANLDLFYDYRNNLELYPTWQQYLRDHQPPVLIVWGKNDAFFSEKGAESFKRDLKTVDYHIYDTGHFALEEEGTNIIGNIRSFMQYIK